MARVQKAAAGGQVVEGLFPLPFAPPHPPTCPCSPLLCHLAPSPLPQCLSPLPPAPTSAATIVLNSLCPLVPALAACPLQPLPTSPATYHQSLLSAGTVATIATDAWLSYPLLHVPSWNGDRTTTDCRQQVAVQEIEGVRQRLRGAANTGQSWWAGGGNSCCSVP